MPQHIIKKTWQFIILVINNLRDGTECSYRQLLVLQIKLEKFNLSAKGNENLTGGEIFATHCERLSSGQECKKGRYRVAVKAGVLISFQLPQGSCRPYDDYTIHRHWPRSPTCALLYGSEEQCDL